MHLFLFSSIHPLSAFLPSFHSLHILLIFFLNNNYKKINYFFTYLFLFFYFLLKIPFMIIELCSGEKAFTWVFFFIFIFCWFSRYFQFIKLMILKNKVWVFLIDLLQNYSELISTICVSETFLFYCFRSSNFFKQWQNKNNSKGVLDQILLCHDETAFSLQMW